MSRVLLAAFVWMFTTVPCQAATTLELGTTPHVAVHLESQRASVGLGVGVYYFEESFPTILGMEETHTWVFSPSAVARLFLSDGNTRSFLEARATKGITALTRDSEGFYSSDIDQYYDNWTTSLGVGCLD